ncbi:hypothetical protein K488DRAFT_91766 [Vararia minispora EC-137]|uniref:Uncharacterized protein n=1 Tax=Vararia minispora EC-137 TaxID=1314806 RepID=A0ACB8Q5A1_9AGAM|nr:hypothetical protein K488DRAFT_91766 [Vararia minispora EC-137]
MSSARSHRLFASPSPARPVWRALSLLPTSFRLPLTFPTVPLVATGSRSPDLLVRLARGMSPFVALKLVLLPGLATRLARRRRLFSHAAIASSRMPVPRVVVVGSRSLVPHSRLARVRWTPPGSLLRPCLARASGPLDGLGLALALRACDATLLYTPQSDTLGYPDIIWPDANV